jgi:uncharacterized protein YjbI with pentapeptide repeats
MEPEQRLAELEEENASLRRRIEYLERERALRHVGHGLLAKIAIRVVAGASLRQSVSRLVDELYDNMQVEKQTIKDTAYAILHRLTRVGTITLLLATVPLVFAALQVYYLRQQNFKFDYQNRRIEQQTYLQEAERRGSLVFLLDNTLDKIDDEVKANPRERRLTPQLIGRIVALSKALKPYRYLENDSITPRYSSPERGQLLLSLTTSRLHPESLELLYASADFSYADLEDVSLEYADLRRIKLQHATLRRVDLAGANLTDANFSGAEFTQVGTPGRPARFDNANFYDAELTDCDFSGSFFNYANFTACRLRRVIFRSAVFHHARFADAALDTVDFRQARLLATALTLRRGEALTVDGLEVDSATLGQLRLLPGQHALTTTAVQPEWLPLLDTPFIDVRGKPFVIDTGLWVFKLK